MKAARKQAHLSQVEAAYKARDYLPKPMWFSHGIIQRLENGAITEEEADTFLLVILARVYNCSVSALSPAAAMDLDLIREVVESSLPWIATIPGQLDLLAVA